MAYDDEDEMDQDRWEPTRENKRQLPSGLRSYLNKLEKENKSLSEQSASLAKTTRQQVIQSVLAAKGVNPKLAAFIQPEVDSTEEAVSKWIDDYADVFNLAAPAQTPVTQEVQVDPRTGQPVGGVPVPVVPQTYTLADQAAQAAMNAAGTGGTPIEVAGDMLAKIQGAKSADDLNALLGAPSGARFGN